MFGSKKNKIKQSNFNASSKKKRSIWNIILASGISAVTLGGSATAIYFSTTNYNLSSQYGKAYSTTFKTNTLNDTDKTTWYENPCLDDSTKFSDELRKNAPDQIKNAYSHYLSNLNIGDFNMSSTPFDTNSQISIQSILPNHKFTLSSSDPDYDSNGNNKRDESPIDIYLEDTSSSRISLVYGRNGDSHNVNGSSSIIIPEEYCDYSNNRKVQLSGDNKNIYVPINADLGKDIATALIQKEDKSSNQNGDDSAPVNDEFYIIDDINGLINRMWIDIQLYYISKTNPSLTESNQWLNYACKFMSLHGDDTFAKDYYIACGDNVDHPDVANANLFVNGLAFDTQNFSKFNNDNPNEPVPCGSFYKWIDGTYDQTKTPKWSFTGNVKYDFMKNYVLHIQKSAKLEDINKFIPDENTNDPTNKKKKANHNWMIFGDSLSISQKAYKAYTKHQFDLPQQNFGYIDNAKVGSNFGPDSDISNTGIFNLLCNKNNPNSLIKETSPSFANSWFKTSPLISSLIALIVTIMLIGIVISILYRIPWLFAFGCMLATLSLTLLFMLLGGYAISLGLFVGMLAVFICSTLTICLFMERLRKQLYEGKTPLVSIKKNIKSAILQGIDIHFVNLLIAVCFILLGSLDLNTMGMCMAIGTLLSAIFILCLWPTMCWLYYLKDLRNLNLTLWLDRKKIKTDMVTNQSNLSQTTFATNDWKFKLNVFNNIGRLISIIIASAVVIVGAILLTVNTSHNVTDIFANQAIGEYYLNSFYCWLLSLGLISLYALIRLNWTSFIPFLVTLIASSLISFMLLVVCQIPLNSVKTIESDYVVAIAFAYTINVSMAIILCGNLNNSWVKTHVLNKKGLKDILNLELKNNSSFMIQIISVVIGSLALSLFLSSTSLILIYLVSIIFIVVGIISIYSVLPWMLYYFIWLRYLYISNNQRRLDGSFEKTNYDDVDEQEINDINKFKRVKASI